MSDRAKIIKSELLKIAREGPLTPERIVEASRPKYHPLHDCFDWDDTHAADQFRFWQARHLVAVYLVEEVDGQTYRSHVSVTTIEHGRSYIPLDRVMSDKELRTQEINYILSMIKAWKRTHKHCLDLLDSFEKIATRAKRKKPPKK